MAEKQKDTESEVAVYDLGYHLVDSVSEDEVATCVKKVQAYIAKAGGSILHEKAPTRVTLAYTISRMTKGKREDYVAAYFGSIFFESSRAAITDLEKALTAEPDVLRYLLIESDEGSVAETVKAERVVEKAEETATVSEEELDKSIEALTA